MKRLIQIRRTAVAVSVLAAVSSVLGCGSDGATGFAGAGDASSSLDGYIDGLVDEYPGLWYGATTARGAVYARGAGYSDVASRQPVRRNTAMYAFSLAKLVTSLSVVQLSEAGLVDIDRAVSDYLPWVPYAGTVRHYLSHSAGVPNPVWGSYFIHWHDAHSGFDRDAFLREVCAANPNALFDPGQRVEYTNLGYAILGALIEERTGMRYEAYAEEQVFAPLEMRNATFDPSTVEALSDSYISRNPVTRVAMKLMIRDISFTREGSYLSIPSLYHFDFPSHGGLVTPPADLEAFLQAVLKRDLAVLSDAGWKQWLAPQQVADGTFTLGWRVAESDRGRVVTHAGGAMGHAALVRVYLDAGIATYFQSNILDSMRVEKTDMDVLDHLLFSVAKR